MSRQVEPLELQSLLEHQGWVRTLARQLVGDARAEEVSQETWVAALRSPPSGLGAGDRQGVRRWLAAVARNAARQLRRSEARREERERRAARPEATPSPEELLQRAQLQRRVAEAVEALAEPYRSTLLLRFFEELPPREIARSQGVPVETVRTRLARGLEQLRTRLDARHGGDRSQWLPGLAALSGAPVALPVPGGALVAPAAATAPLSTFPSLLGVALMNTKLVLSVAGAVALGVSAWLVTRPSTPAPARPLVGTPAAAPAEAALPTPPRPQATPTEPRVGERTRAVATDAAPATPTVPSAESPPSAVRVEGRVLGPESEPLAGVRVVLSGPEAARAAEPAETRSGSGGRFALETSATAGSLEAVDPSWSTVYASSWHQGQERDPVVVVAPRVELAATVRDPEGLPVEGARVELELPEAFRSRFAAVLDDARARDLSAVSDAAGAFELEDVPLLADALVVVARQDFETARLALGEVLEAGLVTLSRPLAEGGLVRGLVRDPYGQPVAGAQVALGLQVAATAGDGSFALELDDPESINAWLRVEPTSLTAVAPGWLPAVYEPPLASDGSGARAWPAHVTLELFGEPLELYGTVVDHRGEPLPGARVWLADPTMLGAIGRVPTPVEYVLAGSPGSRWLSVEVDEAGDFRLEGLTDRPYLLRAMDPGTLVIEEFGPFDAQGPGGRPIELALPTDRVHPYVRGRVLAPDGTPIPGATVRPMCDAHQAFAAGQQIGTSHATLPGTTTDGEGRFELQNVPTTLVYLRVDGEGILPLEFGRVGRNAARGGLDPSAQEGDVNGLPGEGLEELELRVARRAHLQVETARPGAEAFAVLDSAGRRLELSLMTTGSRSSGETAPIYAGSGGQAGRSDTVAVPETGRTLVLLSNGRELGRMALELDPGQVTSVVF